MLASHAANAGIEIGAKLTSKIRTKNDSRQLSEETDLGQLAEFFFAARFCFFA